MKTLAAIVALLICNCCYCQNLIPNPGFEKVINCELLGSGISFQTAPPWNGPDLGTADLFNTCAIVDDRWLVPVNGHGYQYPHSGNGYAGAVFYADSSLYREYLQVKLDSDLVANQTYDVSFYVSLSSAKDAGCNNIGLYFSKTAIQTDTLVLLHLLPQIVEKAIITDTAKWTAVGGKFLAQGGERYIIIGNFFDNKSTRLIYADSRYTPFSYYYIDDVNIHRGSPLCNADFKIQANPSVNFIQITGPSCKLRIRIFNVIGQLLYETDFIYSTNIGVGFLPAGIYFIECLNGMQRMTKKFLKG